MEEEERGGERSSRVGRREEEGEQKAGKTGDQVQPPGGPPKSQQFPGSLFSHESVSALI